MFPDSQEILCFLIIIIIQFFYSAYIKKISTRYRKLFLTLEGLHPFSCPSRHQILYTPYLVQDILKYKSSNWQAVVRGCSVCDTLLLYFLYRSEILSVDVDSFLAC